MPGIKTALKKHDKGILYFNFHHHALTLNTICWVWNNIVKTFFYLYFLVRSLVYKCFAHKITAIVSYTQTSQRGKYIKLPMKKVYSGNLYKIVKPYNGTVVKSVIRKYEMNDACVIESLTFIPSR